ncbi:type IV pilus modification PilV family protein [Kineococcus sp. SYSU DK005]|uniref:type IV pilus modification PilV family protein n=1 Tax=Kineococcus sp. SYSU DK005 TaxID=3383126 RepID=UPI003D7D7C76
MLRRIRRNDDAGFTMLAVLASMVLIMGLVLVGIGYAVAAHRSARTSQDAKSALSAAQAGLQDFIHRLNACEDYYAYPNQSCVSTTPNPAIRTAPADTNVAVVPGTGGVEQAVYSQRVLVRPTDLNSSGKVRVEVVGQVVNKDTQQVRETEKLVADLGRDGFLRFLYFTDYETFSPANTRLLRTPFTVKPTSSITVRDYRTGATHTLSANVTYTVAQPTLDQVTAGCARYYYNADNTVPNRANFPRTITGAGLPAAGVQYWPGSTSSAGAIGNYQCLTINFSGTDTFDGPVHTNDAMSISGPVTFKDDVTTGWKPTSGTPWYGTGTPSGAGNKPVGAGRKDLPSTTDKQAEIAAKNGCVYTGPTSIVFLANGSMKVRSPATRGGDVNTGCANVAGSTLMSDEQTVKGPANGVVYVKKSTAASGTCLSFQSNPLDVTNYDNAGCTRGDAFVQGTVSGRFTVAAEHDVIVTDDVLYRGGTAGTDALGLIGTNNVAVWHPVNAGGQNINTPADLEIDAAIASTTNSFTVLNHDKGLKLGTLTIRGVIIQRYRGPVATGSGVATSTGYSKNYLFDDRLEGTPPPAFIEPKNDSWDIKSTSIQQ